MKPIAIRGQPAKYPLVCAPLVGATREAVLDEAATALSAEADIVEWRVDFFGQISEASAVLATGHALRRAIGGLPMLFTRRSAAEGGQKVPISEARVVELYAEVCAAGFADLVDYEMSNEAKDVSAIRTVSRKHGVGLVSSSHDFERTPPLAELVAHYRRAQALGADVAKVSVMARAPEDALTLLAATLQASREVPLALIGVSMGPHGALSRMIGFAFGSALTFGVAGAASAPGQLPIGELRNAIALVQKSLHG